MNIRFFKINEQTWWFGGGIDLTPHYVVPELAKHFHTKLKEVCDKYNSTWYQQFKQQADDYFFIPHRNETRGVGGVFFDRLGAKTAGFETLFSFVNDIGNTFVPIYSAQSINRNLPFNQEHLKWQKLRRSRYAEFNLVYDRGTKFGLQTQGRTESILMSMPPEAIWQYNYQPNVKEQNTLNYLKKGITWI
jgi:coproporphyrinogen III oxidase